MAKTQCDILIKNGRILTMDAKRQIHDPGAVAINGSLIVDVGAEPAVAARVDATQSIDADGGIVHPGFIDAHNHIVHTTCRGVFRNLFDVGSSSINFADWKAGVTEEDEAAATALASVEMLRGGFTLFIEPGSLFSTAAAAYAVKQVGIRALFSPPYLWDLQEPFNAMPALMSESLLARAPIDHEQSMKQIDAELFRNHDPDALVRGYIFIYGEGTGSPELIKAAHACAVEHKVPFHLHAGYTPKGAQIYRSMTGTSQIVHLRHLGVLGEQTVIVHANILDEDEETAVRETGCQIIWCPVGFFSLGIAKQAFFMMGERWRAGTRISLGTDGAFDFPPGENIRAARLMSQAYADPFSPEELLEMQTVNAASAAGLEAELGSLEFGKRADLVIRDPYAAETYPDNNACHVLALTLGPGSVRTVLVDGRVVFDDGHPTQVEERSIYREVSRSVLERAKRLNINPGPEWPVRS